MLINTFSAFILHLVVDSGVSAQGRCIITPISPTTLTTAGGVLPNGTKNVMIRCNCTNNDGAVVGIVRWYYPNGLIVRLFGSYKYFAGDPYRRADPDDANILLVIPTFNYFYGTYTCGMRVHQRPPEQPNAAISLIIDGK